MALISKTIKVRASGAAYRNYIKLGYDCKFNEYITINVNHLTKSSAVKVDVKCEGGCEKIFSVFYFCYLQSVENDFLHNPKYIDLEHIDINKPHDYCCNLCVMKIKNSRRNNPMLNTEIAKKSVINSRKAVMELYGVEYIGQVEEFKQKRLDTLLRDYGTTGILSIPEIKAKSNKTMMERYGTTNFQEMPGFKQASRKKKEEHGFIIPLELMEPFEIYRNICLNSVRIFKSKLFKEWNGYDYYDDEYIKDYSKLHHTNKNYPTIDHKKSVLYGFLNKIPIEEISSINNLCITKRSLNSSKQEMNESEFKELLKNKNDFKH